MDEDETYGQTKKALSDWLKASFDHLKLVKDAFKLETKRFIDEAREEYYRKQHQRKSGEKISE
jgi:hypothetical protein